MPFKFAKKRKRNFNWIVTDDGESNLDVVDGNGYTVYETSEVMVAVINGNNHAPIELNSGGKISNILSKKNFRFNKRRRIEAENIEELEEDDMKGYQKVKREIPDKICEMDSDDSDKLQEETFDDMNESTVSKVSESSKSSRYENPDCSFETDTNVQTSNLEMNNDYSDDLLKEPQSSVNDTQIPKTVQFYKVEDENKYVLHIPYPGIFTFQGKLRVTLLTGKIEAFGSSVSSENEEKTIDIYSPRRCMQISIKSALPSSIPDSSDIESVLKDRAKISEKDLIKLLSSYQPDDTLLLAEKLFSACAPVLNHYFDDVDLLFEKQVLQEGSPLEKDLECLLDSTAAFDRKAFTEGAQWKNIQTRKCNIICGGKGVGKSTLLKYLMNNCISNREPVLCLDLDPGQTEFTAPGCLSAVLVQKPLLGPNFTHVSKPEKMVFLGSVNVALDPVKYMKSVDYITKSCRDDPSLSNIPWFINTMGFNKGIGLDIMVNLIRLLSPDVLIQINSSDNSKNYALNLRPCSVMNVSVASFLPITKSRLNYDFIETYSCARLKGIGFQSGFKPAQLRDLMMLSYFAPLITFPYFSFNAAEPRWIQLSDIYLAVNEAVPSGLILKAFNGSLVGLCNLEGISCTEKLVLKDSEEVFCNIAIQPEVAPCFGLGIVRGIDTVEKKIYVLTPLPDDDLVKVNCLNMGNISPPSSIFLKQSFVDGPTAYTDVSGTENVQSLKRIFKYVPHLKAGENVRQ